MLLLGILAISPGSAAAQTTPLLPSPLSLGDVIRIASERRDEIEAGRARLRAGEARPTIVSALSDPMVSPSIDHLPFTRMARTSASPSSSRFLCPGFATIVAHRHWPMWTACEPRQIGRRSMSQSKRPTLM
jgi:hypothetical protein